jgi:glycosyltransferase involved in cell wall biosynthesis
VLSVIIPANNEEACIGGCLEALLAQEPGDLDSVEIVVAANGCTDRTVAIAHGFEQLADARGWRLYVLDIAEGGKPNALNEGDRAASGDMRVYLDADIVCSPRLLSRLREALDRPEPVYASGELVVAPARSWVTRRFADLWRRLPFVTTDVPGAGLYAVNAAGRARWDRFPRIIADDGYVRLLFRPEERVSVDATFLWPMVEGFSNLVRVRRRQDAGMRELAEIYPHLLQNEGKSPVRPADHLRLFLAAPASYLVYVAVRISTRLGEQRHSRSWSRGR